MKRSEANAIYMARAKFSAEFGCVSTGGHNSLGEPVSEDEYFSRSGCDICPDGLAGTVMDIVYRSHADMEAKRFGAEHIYEGQVCGGCLCSLVNGDDSDLDYSVDDEDEPSIYPTKFKAHFPGKA